MVATVMLSVPAFGQEVTPTVLCNVFTISLTLLIYYAPTPKPDAPETPASAPVADAAPKESTKLLNR